CRLYRRPYTRFYRLVNLAFEFAGGAMTDDEQAIRELISTWMKASEGGDINTVLSLMAGGVVFFVPGPEPFGKEQFRAASEGMKNVRMAEMSDIREIKVLGDWAYIRNYIEITVMPPDGTPMQRRGYTLSILRKQSGGKWALWRDANLVAWPLLREQRASLEGLLVCAFYPTRQLGGGPSQRCWR